MDGGTRYHAWETVAMDHLAKVSPKSIREVDTSFNRLARPYVTPEDDEVYRKSIDRGKA